MEPMTGVRPGDFVKLAAICERRFGSHKPARSTAQLAALPRGPSIEIAPIVNLA